MSDIRQIVKQQVQNGLKIEQDGSSELNRLLKDGRIETYYLDVNLYISATLELLYLQDYICESIKKQKKSDSNSRSVVFISYFDTSPWFADLVYQGVSPYTYEVFLKTFFPSVVVSLIQKKIANVFSEFTGPVYMRAFEADVSVEQMAKLITDDLFSMRRLGRAQALLTSTLPAALCFGYSLYQQQGFLKSALNGLIGNLYLTNEAIKRSRTPSVPEETHDASRDQRSRGNARRVK